VSIHRHISYVCQCAKLRAFSVNTCIYTYTYTHNLIYLAVDLQHFVAVITLAYQCVYICAGVFVSSAQALPFVSVIFRPPHAHPLSLSLSLSLCSLF